MNRERRAPANVNSIRVAVRPVGGPSCPGEVVDTSVVSLVIGIGLGAGIALLVIAVLAPRHLRDARRTAIDQHRAVTHGQVYEQLVPYLPDFDFNPKDARFLGRPVDFVVFDGLDEGELRRIVFIEVKTGGSKLTRREQLIRDAVREGRVSWKEIRNRSQVTGRGSQVTT